MYTEWVSLSGQIISNVNGSQQQSTLNKFNPLISRDVTAALVDYKKTPAGSCKN